MLKNYHKDNLKITLYNIIALHASSFCDLCKLQYIHLQERLFNDNYSITGREVNY